MSSTKILLLLGFTAPLGLRHASAASIFTECEIAATNFDAALQFFKPFEVVVRRFEIDAFQGHAHSLDNLCANPFRGATNMDPLKGSAQANISIQVSDDGLELFAQHSNNSQRSLNHNAGDGSLSLERSLKRYGKILLDAYSPSFSGGVLAPWIIMTKSNQPRMLAQDVFANSWPLPVFSRYSRSSESFSPNKLGHALFMIPFGDVPIPDRSFQHYAYKGRGSKNSSWSSARDDILSNYKAKPWSERTTALKYESSLGNGPYRSFFLRGVENQMKQWTLSNKSMPTEIIIEQAHKRREDAILTFDDMCSSKYLLHISGISCAATLKYKLACGSLVFIARNPFVEFWHGALKHSENVIFVEPDGSDFLDKLDYAVKNDNFSKTIARRGSLLAETVLSDKSVDCYWILALERYLSLFQRVRHLCEHARDNDSVKTDGAISKGAKLNSSDNDVENEMLYLSPADEPVFYEVNGSRPSIVMSIRDAKRIHEHACVQKPHERNSTRSKGRIAFLFRGESFRNNFFQKSRSRCCRAGAITQRMLFESHEKMFNQIIAEGYSGVDVFGTTYRYPEILFCYSLFISLVHGNQLLYPYPALQSPGAQAMFPRSIARSKEIFPSGTVRGHVTTVHFVF